MQHTGFLLWRLFFLQSTGSRAHRLSGCGTWAQLPCSMWDVSPQCKDGTHVPCIGRWILSHYSTREVPHCSFVTVLFIHSFRISQQDDQPMTFKYSGFHPLFACGPNMFSKESSIPKLLKVKALSLFTGMTTSDQLIGDILVFLCKRSLLML